MKNTSRIHGKNNPDNQIPQGKKPSIPGQNATPIGRDKSKTAGKITLGAARIGEALGLTDDEIKALALLLEWEQRTVSEYCKEGVLCRMQASFDDLQFLASDESRPDEKAWAEKFWPSLSPFFRKEQHPKNPIIAQAMVKTAGDIAAEEKAAKAALWSAISGFENVIIEAKKLLRLLANNFEFLTHGGDIGHDDESKSFSTGIYMLASQVRDPLTTTSNALDASYRLLK